MREDQYLKNSTFGIVWTYYLKASVSSSLNLLCASRKMVGGRAEHASLLLSQDKTTQKSRTKFNSMRRGTKKKYLSPQHATLRILLIPPSSRITLTGPLKL